MRNCLPIVALLLISSCARHRETTLPREQLGGGIVREQLIVHCDFDLPREHRLLDEVTALRNDLTAKLKLPASGESIHVYLFESKEKFAEFTAKEFPNFPTRRAFFLETDTRLNVYAQWGDNAAEDLRHEVTHGYVHAVVRDLPLWLDEGIAEYFETPRGRGGLNSPHVQLLSSLQANESWSPDLVRLEAMRSAAEMNQQHYAEAWLWTHWLLESTPERLETLRQYVETIRRDGSAPPLSIRLRETDSVPHKQLTEHLQKLAAEQASR